MFAKSLRLVLMIVIVAGVLALPSTASADPKGKQYTVLEFISFFGNWDCYRFENDNTFISTYGLIQGEFTTEELCLFRIFGICVFSIDYYEVKIDSPSNPVYTLFDLGDFVSAQIIIGKIETDDDNGFFLGFESPICAYPARCCPKLPERTPTPIE
jgi:hypothetical protein